MSIPDSSVQGLVNDIVSTATDFRDECNTYTQLALQTVGNKIIPSQVSVLQDLWPVPPIKANFLPVNPTQFQPTVDLRGAFENEYNSLVATLSTRMPAEYANFLAQYFPSGHSILECESAIYNIINGSGLPLQAQQEFNTARDRELQEAQRLSDEAYSSAASRGYSIPPGATFYAVLQANQQASRNISATNAQIAVNNAKIQVDIFRDALGKALQLKQQAVEDGLRWIDAIFKEYDAADEKAKNYVQAYEVFYQTFASYYNAVLGLNRLTLDVSELSTKYSLEDKRNSATYKNEFEQRQADIYLRSAQTSAQMASAGLSGVNALVNIGDVSTTSQ